MNKELCWMFKPHNAAVSEMVQRTAFNFGYKWQSGHDKPLYLYELYSLVFFQDTKLICIGSVNDYPQATSLEQALALFKNPPKPKTKEIPHAVLHIDGSITLSGGMLSGEAFDLLVKTRNEYMGVAK